MNARFVLVSPEPRPGDIKVKLPCIVGRSKQAGLTIIHSSISRQHCELTEYEGQLVANDLGSLNGTFINETRIAEPTILPAGGTLRMGSVILEAHYGDDADLAPPTTTKPAARSATQSAPASVAAAGEEDPEYEMVNFTSEDNGGAQPTSEGDSELELSFDDEETTAAPVEPTPAKTRKAAIPAPAKPTTARPAAPAQVKPAKPATAEGQTVSFLPSEAEPATEEVDPDMAAFFKSLQ